MGRLNLASLLTPVLGVCSLCLWVCSSYGAVPSNPKVSRGSYDSSLRSLKKSKSKYVTTQREIDYKKQQLKGLLKSYRQDVRRIGKEIDILKIFQERAQSNLKKTLTELKKLGALDKKISSPQTKGKKTGQTPPAKRPSAPKNP